MLITDELFLSFFLSFILSSCFLIAGGFISNCLDFCLARTDFDGMKIEAATLQLTGETIEDN